MTRTRRRQRAFELWSESKTQCVDNGRIHLVTAATDRGTDHCADFSEVLLPCRKNADCLGYDTRCEPSPTCMNRNHSPAISPGRQNWNAVRCHHTDANPRPISEYRIGVLGL